MKELYNKTAVLNTNKGFYHHFGIRKSTACLYGDKPEDIMLVEFKISEDQTIPEFNNKDLNADYWGWYEPEKDDFTMIYPKRFLLDMCFPAGITGTEEGQPNKGKSYRLEIIGVNKPNPTDI